MTAQITGSEQKKEFPVVTILTLVGTIGAAIIPILLNMYGSQISNKPDVNLAVTPNLNNDSRKSLIELRNHGSSTATNLSLTIQTPNNISSITNEFSSTDITIPKFNKTSLDMHVPKTINQRSLKLYIAKFSGGSGSIAKLETLMNNAKQNSSYYNYTLTAAYDQGSTTGKVMKPSDAPTLTNFPSKVAEYIVENPILVASEIAIIPIGWISIRWWLGKRFRNRAIRRMLRSMLGIRDVLKTASTFGYVSRDQFSLKIEDIYAGGHIFFSVGDLTIMHDLWQNLAFREEYVQAVTHRTTDRLTYHPSHPPKSIIYDDIYTPSLDSDTFLEEIKKTDPLFLEKIKKYNAECLSKLNEALEKIDWTKYRR